MSMVCFWPIATLLEGQLWIGNRALRHPAFRPTTLFLRLVAATMEKQFQPDGGYRDWHHSAQRVWVSEPLRGSRPVLAACWGLDLRQAAIDLKCLWKTCFPSNLFFSNDLAYDVRQDTPSFKYRISCCESSCRIK